MTFKRIVVSDEINYPFFISVDKRFYLYRVKKQIQVKTWFGWITIKTYYITRKVKTYFTL